MSEGTAPARAEGELRLGPADPGVEPFGDLVGAGLARGGDRLLGLGQRCGPELLELPLGGLRRGDGGVALGLHRVEGPLAGVAQAQRRRPVRTDRGAGVGAGWACGVGAGALAAGGVWGGVAPPAAGVAPAGVVGSLMRVAARLLWCQSARGCRCPASGWR